MILFGTTVTQPCLGTSINNGDVVRLRPSPAFCTLKSFADILHGSGSIINLLLDSNTFDSREIGIAYFFFTFRDKEKQSEQNMLSAT